MTYKNETHASEGETAVTPFEIEPSGNSSGVERSLADGTLLDTLAARRSVGPIGLSEPGPTDDQIRRLIAVASRVPDHGALVPWRFILVQGEDRTRLAKRMTDAYLWAEGLTPENVTEAAAVTVKRLQILFSRPPLIVIVVSRPDADSRIPVFEQTLSAGAACMNLIAGAASLGFASTWLTGWSATNPAGRPVLGLAEGEIVAGIIPIGTVSEPPKDRPRPEFETIASAWSPTAGG